MGKKGILHYPKRGEADLNHFRFLIQFASEEEREAAKKLFLENGVTAISPLKIEEVPHRLLKLDPKDFPQTEQAASTTLSLPIHPTLTSKEVEYIAEIISKL